MSSIAKRTLPTPPASKRLGPLDVLILSAWCGLAAGELEVLIRFLHRNFSSTDRLYLLTRHFVWTVPLVSLLVFLGLGAFWAATTKIWPRRAGWLSPRLISVLALLLILTVAGPGIYMEAWLILALGIASSVCPVLERHAAGMRWWLSSSFPALLGMVLVQAALIVGGDRLKEWREESRPLPPAESPNVLLIVLDTVRADHLSLYGYARPTSPALERLAARGASASTADVGLTQGWTNPRAITEISAAPEPARAFLRFFFTLDIFACYRANGSDTALAPTSQNDSAGLRRHIPMESVGSRTFLEAAALASSQPHGAVALRVTVNGE